MAASDIGDATQPGAMFYTPSAVGVTRDDGVEHVLFIYGLWRSWATYGAQFRGEMALEGPKTATDSYKLLSSTVLQLLCTAGVC